MRQEYEASIIIDCSICGEQPVLQTVGFARSAPPKIAPTIGDLRDEVEGFGGSNPPLSANESGCRGNLRGTTTAQLRTLRLVTINSRGETIRRNQTRFSPPLAAPCSPDRRNSCNGPPASDWAFRAAASATPQSRAPERLPIRVRAEAHVCESAKRCSG